MNEKGQCNRIESQEVRLSDKVKLLTSRRLLNKYIGTTGQPFGKKLPLEAYFTPTPRKVTNGLMI